MNSDPPAIVRASRASCINPDIRLARTLQIETRYLRLQSARRPCVLPFSTAPKSREPGRRCWRGSSATERGFHARRCRSCAAPYPLETNRVANTPGRRMSLDDLNDLLRKAQRCDNVDDMKRQVDAADKVSIGPVTCAPIHGCAAESLANRD